MTDPLCVENEIARKVIHRYIAQAIHELGGLDAFVRFLVGRHVHSTIVSASDGVTFRVAVKFTIEIDDGAEAIREAIERGILG